MPCLAGLAERNGQRTVFVRWRKGGAKCPRASSEGCGGSQEGRGKGIQFLMEGIRLFVGALFSLSICKSGANPLADFRISPQADPIPVSFSANQGGSKKTIWYLKAIYIYSYNIYINWYINLLNESVCVAGSSHS